MKAQTLDRTLTAFRLGDAQGEHPIFSAKGSALYPGRWNTAETPIIYTSQHFSTALMELLVSTRRMPPNQHFIEITIDAGCSYEVFSEAHYPDWIHPDRRVSRAFGAAWHREARSAILMVPSIVARMEHNLLINPDHPDFDKVSAGLHHPVWWDDRLFG